MTETNSPPPNNESFLPQSTVLIVDDNPQNVELLQAFLESLPVKIVTAFDGLDALQKVADHQPDLILLDIMMPQMSGFQVCRRLKGDPKTRDIQVLMVTALNELGDIEQANECGTDDFVSKPFSIDELTARMEAALRRTSRSESAPQSAADRECVGELVLDQAHCRVTLRGEVLRLTPTEFRLLCALASRPGEVFSRKELAELVWGYHDADVGRTLDVHMRRMRAKLKPSHDAASFVTTLRGFGYQLLLPEQQHASRSLMHS